MIHSTIREVQLLRSRPELGSDDALLVGVVSDSDITGLGEVCPGSEDEALGVVEELAVQLVGRPMVNREALWQAMSSAGGDYEGHRDMVAAVLSGLDTALWDLAGKSLQLPCGVLMGGRARASLEVCVDCGDVTEGDAARRAESGFKAGARIFSFDLPKGDADDISNLKRARKPLKSEALVAVRVLSPLESVEEAIAVGSALDRLEPFWVEGLVRDGRWRELGQVRKSIESAIATGHTTISAGKFWGALEAGCADSLTPQLVFCGGPTGALKLATAVELRGVRMALGATDTVVSLLSAAQVGLARNNVSPLIVTADLFAAAQQSLPDRVINGFIRPSDAPGLGLPDALCSRLELIDSFAADGDDADE